MKLDRDEVTAYLTQPTADAYLSTFSTLPDHQRPPSPIMTTSLDALKQTGTVVVSDSGDFECESHLLRGSLLCSECEN